MPIEVNEFQRRFPFQFCLHIKGDESGDHKVSGSVDYCAWDLHALKKVPEIAEEDFSGDGQRHVGPHPL